jgi:hypothetical protein
MDFVRFLGLRWPEEATRLFTVSVADVLGFRDWMLAESKAPKTINRRIASLSSFYKYLQGVASEFRLPITVPNPAHAQFIPRARPILATRPRPSRRPVPGSSWGSPPATRCSTTATGPSSSSSSIAGPGSGRRAASESKTSTRTARRRPSRSMRRATSTAALGCTLPRRRPLRRTLPRRSSRRGRSSAPGSTRGAKS